MTQQEAIELIQPAIDMSIGRQTWLDLGCGSGTFTRALAALLPADSVVYAVDREQQTLPRHYKEISIHFTLADFAKDDLNFNNVNGMLLANSLHYVAQPLPLINRLAAMLNRTNGRFVLVEYNRRKANQWVPYPISFDDAKNIFSSAGFKNISKTGERPSQYGQATIYGCFASL